MGLIAEHPRAASSTDSGARESFGSVSFVRYADGSVKIPLHLDSEEARSLCRWLIERGYGPEDDG